MRKRWVLALLSPLCFSTLQAADSSYVEPGSLRLSHNLMLDGVFHKEREHWFVQNVGIDKTHTEQPKRNAWHTEWGQYLQTEASARFTPDVFARVLFEAQADYADRFWRPVNINHYIDDRDREVFLRQAEAGIEKDSWFLKGFTGVPHGDWGAQGDFFHLYPASNPDDDYLGSSGYFGIYPDRWKQDHYLNISRRHVPRGFEGGANVYGFDVGAAYGDELSWGYQESVYGRIGFPVGQTRLTFVMKNEDVPFEFDDDRNERNEAYALAWNVPFEAGHRLDLGVLYNPFRDGRPYEVDREVSDNSGIFGSTHKISVKESKKSDGIGERIRYERHDSFMDREWMSVIDLTRLGILAGNKQQADFQLGTQIVPTIRGQVQAIYRKPIEGPIPFLFEGSPDNIGAVASFPRGPESPFTVNWDNREAVFFVTSFIYDPTPGTNFFIYDPNQLQAWNLNAEEDAPFAFAVQYKASDYKTTTDRQYYFNVDGNLVWETAAHSGAWPSDGFLHEVRLLGHGKWGGTGWTLGLAGGQAPAYLGLAYTDETDETKAITEYVSLEGRLEYWPFALWGHYGSGVWGPERNTHPFFGLAFDRVFGLGTTYNFTRNTSVDLGYIGTRQDDDLFVAPDLGEYDEYRLLFSHRFGFQFYFQEAGRSGSRAR